ncbi:MAG: pyruvate kinase [Oligoflexia bacterium]|nr:pyruvate kinase [Oligoflexia bacterium]
MAPASSALPASKGGMRFRKTKIIVTIGPASNSVEVLKRLIEAGANVFRLNFSHGSHADHLGAVQNIRKASEELNIPVGILQDLSGPKIRISAVKGDTVQLKDQQKVLLKAADGSQSDTTTIYVESLDPVKILKPGHQVLLADGIITLEAELVNRDSVECVVVSGAGLRSKVGISFPDSVVDLPATTDKDLTDVQWAITNKIDFIAISFVKSAADILRVRELLHAKGSDGLIIAKIERKAALENIHEIMDVTDGIMVARGDLGLELPLEQVPMLQKRLIEQANYQGIPVIVATQMLHSMVKSLRPTRAEVSDIATAVMSGTDALMLSEETAIGEHPVECVQYLGKVAREAEKSFVFDEYKLRLRDSDRATVPDAVAYAAAAAAVKVNAAAIIACTEKGTSARLIAKYRPQQPLYGASTKSATLQRMALYWGVIPIPLKATASHDDEIQAALESVQIREGLLNGSRAVVTGGMATGKSGSTSILEIREMNFR